MDSFLNSETILVCQTMQMELQPRKLQICNIFPILGYGFTLSHFFFCRSCPNQDRFKIGKKEVAGLNGY